MSDSFPTPAVTVSALEAGNKKRICCVVTPGDYKRAVALRAKADMKYAKTIEGFSDFDQMTRARVANQRDLRDKLSKFPQAE